MNSMNFYFYLNKNKKELTIPINEHEKRTYSFQISPEDKTPEVFQCIRQINRKSVEILFEFFLNYFFNN